MRQKNIHASLSSFLAGEVILIDKPLHWTSFDAVKKVRIATGVSKVGHAGTLDPLATGLLIICTGAFTKKINEYMGMEKEYTGTFIVGAETPTYDLESEPCNFKDYSHLNNEDIADIVKRFTGNILQTPPGFSAIKQNGKPVYLAARKGVEVQLQPRPVLISLFCITNIELPEIAFRVTCSTGTYIRSLAHDFGHALNTGDYLSSLRRTRIGNFSVEDAVSPQAFTEKVQAIKAASERQADA